MENNTPYAVVIFYDKDLMPRKVSRFGSHEKAKNQVMRSLLIGQHAEIVAFDLSEADAKKYSSDYHRVHQLKARAKTLLPRPEYPAKPRKIRERAPAKITTRIVGEHEIKRAQVRFAPGVK